MQERSIGAVTTPDPDALLTARQAAELIGVSTRALEAWRSRGDGPDYVHVSARCVRYTRAALRAWAASRVRRSTAEYGHAASA